MKIKRRILVSVGVAAATAVVLLDEGIKAYALEHFPSELSLKTSSLLAFAVHRNTGIAFDIPFKLPIILIASFVLGILLAEVAWKQRQRAPILSMFALFILIGASGNLYDRLAYGFTVDYLILFGRSAINLSDLVILMGVFGILEVTRKKKRLDSSQGEPVPIDNSEKMA